ncbi:MAG: peptidase, partial [Pirellulales bacterium]|nr:peptidase [Pirellulales bacterium]
VVADRANARLQWFDMAGKHLGTQGGFLFPADIDTQGDLMLVPDLHARITLLDKTNQVVAQLGDDEAWRARVLDNKESMRASPDKWQAGRFIHPHDACFDADGNIYVTEWVRGGRVTKLVRV